MPAEERRLLAQHVSEDVLLDVLLPAQDGVHVKDRAGRYLMINSAGAASLGYTSEQLVGKTDREIFPGELGNRLALSDQGIMSAGESRTLEEPVIVGGELRSYLTTKAPLRDSSGVVIGLIGVSTDVTALKQPDEGIRRREAQLAEAQALAKVGSWDWEVSSGTQIWSDEAYRIIGLDPDGPAPTFEDFLERVHPDDRKRLSDEVARSMQPGSKGEYEIEHRIVRPDREVRVCRCRGRVFFDLDGTPLRMVGAVVDITERRREEQALERRALVDPLTGLPNRSLAFDRLRHALELTRRRESPLAVLFIDLDGFKSVNDELGHEAGDQVLAEAAKRLLEVVRASDTVGRVGGDEFVAICEDVASPKTATPTRRAGSRGAGGAVSTRREVVSSLGQRGSGPRDRCPRDAGGHPARCGRRDVRGEGAGR